jgi:dipeptidyl aminopeptidase/acylaminoacyl peptidase
LLGDNVKINKDKIHIMGHSFGGTTALYSAINDKRITGSVISFDPCFYIM